MTVGFLLRGVIAAPVGPARRRTRTATRARSRTPGWVQPPGLRAAAGRWGRGGHMRVACSDRTQHADGAVGPRRPYGGVCWSPGSFREGRRLPGAALRLSRGVLAGAGLRGFQREVGVERGADVRGPLWVAVGFVKEALLERRACRGGALGSVLGAAPGDVAAFAAGELPQRVFGFGHGCPGLSSHGRCPGSVSALERRRR